VTTEITTQLEKAVTKAKFNRVGMESTMVVVLMMMMMMMIIIMIVMMTTKVVLVM